MGALHRFVHPFPARMAPELVDQRISSFDSQIVVLDPMMGSGSFVLGAARAGHTAIGVDSDPLAVLIAQAAIGAEDPSSVVRVAEVIVAEHEAMAVSGVVTDDETEKFISYWFDSDTAPRLAGLARRISEVVDDQTRVILWCAFSRLIITKDAGASKARDVSHSRPHVVRDSASFDPVAKFVQAVKTVLTRASRPSDFLGELLLIRGDSRNIPLAGASVDAIMTSPPYLNAIDYLRGHRLSLVWMGYSIADLRALRGENIGSERGTALSPNAEALLSRFTDIESLPRKKSLILNRYVNDLGCFMREVARVLKDGGEATFVVANSTHQSVPIRVDDAIEALSIECGLAVCSRIIRALPAQRRYLPPPVGEKSVLRQRMAEEVILTVRKSSDAPDDLQMRKSSLVAG